MNEYISREAMLKNLTSDLEHHSDEGDPRTCLVMRRFIKYVEDFPAADVQPVKHGVWRKDEQGYDVYVECSECGLNLSISNYIENEWRETLKYCPNCGARMDLGDEKT